ncbi:Alpha/Beta hydrolase protein [Thelonectria olida]|uniref:Carboxylic ester hydrolase n=1 Tax=Thelonectria olida TaxID=1576542 RepID=A0A9P9AI79_9HYPO|nr:Alpha/Beta hydrolase protein [Thelonectria olida]
MDSSTTSSSGGFRRLSNSSTSSVPSTSHSESASSIPLKTKSSYVAVPDSDEVSDAGSDFDDDDPLHIPIVKPKRNWKLILLLVVPPVIVVVALSLALGFCYGLHHKEEVVLPHEEEDNGLVPGPVIDLGYSRYQGLDLHNGVSEFLGMRYAKPPTGDLRWRAPVDPEQTSEIQSAQSWGAHCLGVHQMIESTKDEDCLHVNVWKPTNATSNSSLPVVVYIQGGGYMVNSMPYTKGSEFVENSGHNLVFVSLNYRVGLWGFLSGEDVKNDGILNAGLHDQRFLLHWVQKHISKFGGNPDHVVIQGTSAGAGSVGLHLAAFGGRNDSLFVGAIAESTFWPGQRHYSDLEFQYQGLLRATYCSRNADKMACLRNLDARYIQPHNVNLAFRGRGGLPLFYWLPVTDGDFLRDTPYNLYQRGDFVKVPILYGSNSNEGTSFVPNVTNPVHFAMFMEDNYPLLTRENTNAMLDNYPLEDAVPMYASWYPSVARAFGEATFICPTSSILNAFKTSNSSSANTANIFSYRFNLTDYEMQAEGRGVPHSFEDAAVFGPSMVDNAAIGYLTYNAPIVPIMQNYWISFIRSLNPNTYRYKSAPEWLPWGNDEHRLVLQLPDSVMEYTSKNETRRCDFWRSINETMSQ